VALRFSSKYLYGESRWNDIDRGKLLIRPQELSGNSINSHLVAKQEAHGAGSAGFCL
jgi:hypothetical protein